MSAVLVLSTACELPWRSARIKLQSSLWTDTIEVELEVHGIGARVFNGCPTMDVCLANIERGLQIPDSTVGIVEGQWVGWELVDGGAAVQTLELVDNGDEVDLHAHFTAPSTAKLFRGNWLPQVNTSAKPNLRAPLPWRITQENLPSSGAIEDNVEVAYVDLTRAGPVITLEAAGNDDVIPLYMALPGLRPMLASSGLIRGAK